jgi:hypothetical protein
MTGIIILSCCVPVQADTQDGIHKVSEAFEKYGDVSTGDILYQEDFEDEDLTISDTALVNGMTWTANGTLGIGTVNEYDSKIIRMNTGASVLSTQVINQPEYTVAFTILNYYNTAARVFVAYQDDNNCYSFEPTSGKIYRTMDGVEEELTQADVRRFLISPKKKPSVNNYKICFCNDGSSITISVDRDGYKNGKDYDFTFIDQNATAVKRFTITISNPDAGNDGPKCYLWFKQLMNAAKNPEAGVPMDFYPSILCLKDKGILLGNNGDSKWNDPITRAEVLALFERLAKVWGEESNLPPE